MFKIVEFKFQMFQKIIIFIFEVGRLFICIFCSLIDTIKTMYLPVTSLVTSFVWFWLLLC